MFSEQELNTGNWVDFIVEVNWAADSSGLIRVWRQDEGETEFAEVLSEQGIPTLQYAAGSNVENYYWKHGFYRADCDISNVLWLDAMTRGNTFEAVRNAAFDP